MKLLVLNLKVILGSSMKIQQTYLEESIAVFINRLLKICLPFIVLYFALLAVGIPWFSLEEQAPVAQVVFIL